jgi:hypothetical protein
MPQRPLSPLQFAGHVVTGLGLLPGLLTFKLFLAHAAWLLSTDWPSRFGFSGPDYPAYRGDTSMFWAAGFALRQHLATNLYNYPLFAALGQNLFHQNLSPFIYPPTVAPLLAAFSLLPVSAGYYIFNLASLLAAAILLARSRVPGWCIALGLISPAVVNNLFLGQLDLLAGALLIFGLSRLESQPRFAGLVLSLLAFKPQHALLVPAAVLARRRWPALEAGVLGTAALLALSLPYHATASWSGYLHEGRSELRYILQTPFTPASAHNGFFDYAYCSVSVFWMLRSLHCSLMLAYAVQSACSVLAFAFGWRVWRSPAMALRQRLILSVLLTPIIAPYGFVNTLCAVSIVLPMLAARHTPWRNAALAWLWTAPALTPGIVAHYGLSLGPLLPLAALALCLTEQKQPLLAEQIRQPG